MKPPIEGWQPGYNCDEPSGYVHSSGELRANLADAERRFQDAAAVANTEKSRRLGLEWRMKEIDGVLLSATGTISHDVALAMLEQIGRIVRDPA